MTELQLDGLDHLRVELDKLQDKHPSWVFRMLDPGGDTPIGSMQLEAYSEELRQHVGIMIHANQVKDAEAIDRISGRLSDALSKLDAA